MRVLIIDDDEDVVFSLQTILCAKGVEQAPMEAKR